MGWPISRIVSTVFAILFLAAVGFKSAFPGDDPYRCKSLLNTGRWLDPVDDEGIRNSFHNWQPDGCMIRKYTSPDIRRCLEGRSMAFIGDSTSRRALYGLARLVSDSPHPLTHLIHRHVCHDRADFDVCSWKEPKPIMPSPPSHHQATSTSPFTASSCSDTSTSISKLMSRNIQS